MEKNNQIKTTSRKILKYFIEQIFLEEKNLLLLTEADDEPADAGGLDLDAGGGEGEAEGLEDLSFGDEGDVEGEEGGDLGEGGDMDGDLGEEGDLGDEEGEGDEDLGGDLGGGLGGGGGFDFGGGDEGDMGEGPDEDKTDEEEKPKSIEDIEPPEDPIQTTVDIAVSMLDETGDDQIILNAVKSSIQKYFTNFEDAIPIIKSLWDTQHPILKVVARKLLLFIRGV